MLVSWHDEWNTKLYFLWFSIRVIININLSTVSYTNQNKVDEHKKGASV